MKIARIFAAISLTLLGFAPIAASAQDATLPVQVVLPVPGMSTVRAFSPDGRFLLTNGSGYAINLWNLATHELVRTYANKGVQPLVLGFLPGADYFVVGGYQAARVVNLATGEVVNKLDDDGMVALPSMLEVSGDGQRIAIGAVDEDSDFGLSSVTLWDLRTNSTSHTLTYFNMKAIKIDDEERALLIAGKTEVDTYDLDSLSKIDAFEFLLPKEDFVETAAFAPGKRHELAIAVYQGPLSVWDYRKKAKISDVAELLEGMDLWRWLRLLPDGQHIVSAAGGIGERPQAIARDVATGKELGRFDAGYNPSMSADGRSLAVSRDDGFDIIDAVSGAITIPFEHLARSALRSQSADGQIALDATEEGMRLWSPATGATVRKVPAKVPAWLSSDGHAIVGGLRGEALTVWNTAGVVVDSFDSIGTPSSVSFSADGGRAIVQVGDEVHFLDLAARSPPVKVPGFDGLALAVLSPDGKTVAVQEFDNGFSLHAVPGGKLLRRLKGLDVEYGDGVFAFSPDGKRLLGGDGEGEVVLWDTRTGKVAHSLNVGHGIAKTGFSGDGSRYYVCDRTAVVSVWNAADNVAVGKYATDDGIPDLVGFGADGKTLIITMPDGLTHTRDLASGKVLADRMALLADDSVVTVTPEGFYDGEHARAAMRLVHGLDAYAITDAADVALHRPDLVAASLAGDPDGVVKAAAANLDLAAMIEGATPIGGAGGSQDAIPTKPTHVVVVATSVRKEAGATSAGVGDLSPGTQVALVKVDGEWTLVARDGKALGYVATSALAELK